jgi:hypothetical protein
MFPVTDFFRILGATWLVVHPKVPVRKEIRSARAWLAATESQTS